MTLEFSRRQRDPLIPFIVPAFLLKTANPVASPASNKTSVPGS